MTPRVSVIIPTYNREDLVGDAIDSVLVQNFPGTEIIVVDDGSTDQTEARIKAYGEQVRYIRTNNGGVAHARNVGSRAACGQYITFLDSDDRHYPYTLSLQTQLLDRFPEFSLVCAEMSGFDDNGFFERYHLKTYHRSAYRDPRLRYETIFASHMNLSEAVSLPDQLLREDPSLCDRRVYFGNVFDVYLLNTILCQNSVMLRRAILPTIGERNERVKHWQEVDYLLRICRTYQVCFADVPTYQLRYHDGQISTTARADGKQVWLRKQQILLRVTKRHAFADPSYYRAHQAAIDRHLAHLHRAVVVPLLMLSSGRLVRRSYARRARAYLAKCYRYGHPQRSLWLLSFLPGSLRQFGVAVIERLRQARFELVRHIPFTA
jgi:glycosyltransferase involved in cell wall biosynthesis